MPFCVFFWNFRAMTEKSALPTDFLFYLLFLCYSYLINWQVFHFYHLILILYIYIIATIKIIDRFRRSNYLGNQSQVDRTLFQVHIRLGSLVHLDRLILSLNWLVLWILVFFFLNFSLSIDSTFFTISWHFFDVNLKLSGLLSSLANAPPKVPLFFYKFLFILFSYSE